MNTVIGYYTTRYGELWEESLFGMVKDAIVGVLQETTLEKGQIDAIFFSNMLGGVVENNLHATGKIAEIMDVNIPIYRVEGACASGGLAINLAHTYLTANPNSTVLVVGAEKMTDVSAEDITYALSAAASGEEQEAGLTFPGLYAMMTQYYLSKYHYTENNLAYVPVKNHYHATFNDKAHFRKEITMEAVLKSPYVAYPLRVLNSSPLSDGASAVVLTNRQDLQKKMKSVRILSSAVATDTISLKQRKNLDEMLATKIAADKAFTQAKLERKHIAIAEVHDCFSIAELLAMEDLGFWKKGTAGDRIKEQPTRLGSNGPVIINTSGGLKAAGHPVGATGIKQIGEVYLQLIEAAEQRQVKQARYGLAHNVGGSGGTAVVTILGI